jgi:DNA-binding protein YbaB
MAGDVSRLARDLEQTASTLQQAAADIAERRYEATSPDDRVRVAVNGHQRVVALYLDPSALQQDAEQLDDVLTTTLNDALEAARLGNEQSWLEMLPPKLRPAVESAMNEADEV